MIGFDEIFAFAEGVASDVLVDSRHELPATWVLVDAEDNVEIVVTPWANDFEKQAAFAMIRGRLADPRIAAFAFVTEVWLTMQEPGAPGPDGRLKPGIVKPSADPKRREFVVSYVSTRAERAQRMWEIVRDWKGTIRMLRPDPAKSIREPIDGPALNGTIPNMFRDAR